MKKILESKAFRHTDFSSRFIKLNQTDACQNYPLLNFGIGEDTSLVDEEIFLTVSQYFHDKNNYGYSDNICPSLKKAFIDFAYKQYGVSLKDENLGVTMGIKSTLNLLAMLLINPHDTVIVTSPSYSIFEKMARFLKADVHVLKLTKENNYQADIITYVKENHLSPKVIALNYPNNPTGRSVDHSYFEKLVKLVKPKGGYILNDAAYIDFSYKHHPISLLTQGLDNVIELYSGSKTFGITGLRVGMIAGDEKVIKQFKVLQDQFDSGQAFPLLYLYKDLLSGDFQSLAYHKYQRRYYELKDVLEKYDFEVEDLDSTFYIFTKIPSFLLKLGDSAMDIAQTLKKDYGLIAIPYDLDDGPYLRFSLTYKNNEDPRMLDQRLELIRKTIQ